LKTIAVEVSPFSSVGVPLFGQCERVIRVRSFRAPSTMTFGTRAAWAYGRKRICSVGGGLRDLVVELSEAGSHRAD
jgi:hypothetical protein